MQHLKDAVDLQNTATHFAFVIEAGFTMQAFSSAIEVLRVARKLGAEKHYGYSVYTLDDLAVSASNDIQVLPSQNLNAMPKDTIIVMVAGAGAIGRPNTKMVARLRRWALEGRSIWAISSGVIRLAQAGLIDGCKVAAHWEDVPYLKLGLS